MILEAVFRRFGVYTGKAPADARMTNLESIAVDTTSALDAEMSRAGRRFNGIGVAAGAAPIQAIPTTTATHALYNADSRKAYVLDSIGTYLLSGTATAGLSVFVIVSPITATLPAAATGSLVSSASGGGLTSRAIIATAYTLPTPAGVAQWGIAGSSVGGVPGVGGGFTQDVKGRIIVPPGKVLGVAFLAGTGTTPLYVPTFTWHEVEYDLE